MNRINLPDYRGRSHIIIDWHRTPPPEPNHELLAELAKGRKRQSARSKSRVNFIGATVKVSPAEVQARKIYLEEWHIRVSENEHGN